MKTTSITLSILALFVFASCIREELWSYGYWIKTILGFSLLVLAFLALLRSKKREK